MARLYVHPGFIISLKRTTMTNEELVKWLKDTGSPKTHRLNLSKMLIAYLRIADETEGETDRQEVYHTFYVLNQTLKEL